jgi:hypothetical protein
MAIIMGTLECTDPHTNEQRLVASVSGTPQEALAVYEAIRPHLDPAITLVPLVELPKKCKCVVPRLYAYAREMHYIVHGMTLAEYGTGKYVKPCWYCRWNRNTIMEGVRVEPRK